MLNANLKITQYLNSYLPINYQTIDTTYSYNGTRYTITYVQKRLCGINANHYGNCPISLLENQVIDDNSYNCEDLTTRI